MRWVFVALVLVAPLGGCIGSDDRPGADDEPLVVEAPFGCDANRTAWVHGAGAALRQRGEVPRAFGCLYRTGGVTLEPSIGITQDGAVFIGPGTAPLAGGLPAYGTWRSTDEGRTWKVVVPDLAGVPTHPTTQDPFLFVDPVTDRVFVEDLVIPPFNCGSLSWSDDGGASWENSLSGCAQFDHVSIFTGPPVSTATTGYPNLVYRCAISGGALSDFSTMVTCQRSPNGGLTWLPPGTSPFVYAPGVLMPAGGCSGGNGHGVTDSAGRVYLPRGHCGQPWLAMSDDEALTWTPVQIADNGMMCDDAICEHDAGVGIDPEGTLYYAWVAGDRLPYLALSRDDGATWSEPIMIGFPGLVESTHLQLAVGGAGRLAFVYYGSSNSPGAPWSGDYTDVTWGAYIGVGVDASSADPTFQTVALNETNDPFIRGRCGPVRCQEVFDFIDIRIAPDGTAWVPVVDGCSGPCGSGEELADNDDEAAAGRVWGVPLWDENDANGPYPD